MRHPVPLILGLVLAACGGAPVPSSSTGDATGLTPSPVAVASPTAGPTITPRPTPTPVLGAPCPDHAAPSIFELVEADPECFQGDIQLTGWLGRPPAMGFEGPPVQPAWLYYPADDFAALWSVKPEGTDDQGCPDPSPEPCAWIFLHVDPASGIELGAAQRWIKVTGHIHDPAWATCHYDYPDDPTEENPFGSPPEDSLRVDCDRNFVVTQVRTVAND